MIAIGLLFVRMLCDCFKSRSRVAEQGRRETGWRRSLCREISLFLLVGADVRADIREE